MRRLLISTIALAATLTAAPLMAAPQLADLGGTLRGTATAPAQGDVEIVDNNGHQFVKFGQNFTVASQAESEVRHIDGQTGQVTTLGKLVNKSGYQVYEVPAGLKIDSTDRIVVYSPLHADELATVNLADE